MKRIRDETTVPSKPYKYVHEDGFAQYSSYPHVLKKMVLDYRKANQLPIGVNFNQQYEENLCAHAEDGVCVDFIPPTMMEKASMLTKSLVRWAASGFQVRTDEQVQEIGEICKGCEFYGGENGFLRVICKKCGCSKLKQWLQSSHCPIGKW